MYLTINLESFFKSNIGIAILSTLLIPVLFFAIGYILNIITMAFGSMLAEFIGVGFALFIMNNLTFVGTVFHELAHALFAFLTGAKITHIELYNPTNHSLGCVHYYTRGNKLLQAVQCTLASIAPVICGYFEIDFIIKVLLPLAVENWQKGLLIYILVSIFIHMTLSSQDIKVALKGLPLCLPIIFIIVFVTRFNSLIYFQDNITLLINVYKKVMLVG